MEVTVSHKESEVNTPAIFVNPGVTCGHVCGRKRQSYGSVVVSPKEVRSQYNINRRSWWNLLLRGLESWWASIGWVW